MTEHHKFTSLFGWCTKWEMLGVIVILGHFSLVQLSPDVSDLTGSQGLGSGQVSWQLR